MSESEDKQVGQEEAQEEERAGGSSFSAIKIVLLTLGFILLLGISIVGIGGYYIYANIQPVDPGADELVHINVPMGSSTSKISSILEENHLIKNDKIFYYYVRFKGETNFQAGDYYLTAGMEFDEIIEQLQDGKVYSETVRFTVAEGLSIEQTADHLAEEGLIDKERFLALLNEADFSDFSFVADIPDVEHRKYRLEGFLFPETYEIYKGATEEEIIRVMLRQFEKEMTEEWKAVMEERDLSVYDLVTLASVVEREAVLDEERATISGVFHNRIQEEWLLESCATVQFVLGKQREVITFEDLAVESPYNTYLNPGLPPGPIASPGRQSIEATLYPEEHDFFFFVTKKDGTSSHHFSRTYEEHLANDAQSRGNF